MGIMIMTVNEVAVHAREGQPWSNDHGACCIKDPLFVLIVIMVKSNPC